MPMRYNIYRYISSNRQYESYHGGFLTRKAAIAYADQNRTLNESGYKVLREPYFECEADE